VQFVPASEAHPAVHFASGGRHILQALRPTDGSGLFPFRFVQQRADYFASGGGVVALLDVVGNDPKV